MRKKKTAFNPITSKTTDQLLEEMKKREAEKKELFSNYDYILWLEKFTLLYERFTDDSWLYKPEELSEVDIKNVGKIALFFEALSDYCHKYYINVASNEMFESECINIKHNGIGYQIGLVTGQGSCVYVERKVPEDGTIEFSDVLNDTMPEDFEAKKALIKKFEQIVTEMKAKCIPISIILEIVNR